MEQESKLCYRDEDKSMKGPQESSFFLQLRRGSWDGDIFKVRAFKYLNACPGINQRLSLSKSISAAIDISEPTL